MKFFRLFFFLLITSTIQGQSLCPIITSDIKVCPNTNGQLTASGADFYTWTPSQGLSDSTIANPVVKVAASTLYFVTGYTESSNNLIKNGDFTKGKNSFTSNYNFTTTDLVPEGNYTVGTNPRTYHTGFSSCKDHTTGSGNMLIVNGIPVSNSTIWEQTITIKPNQDYAFYAYVTPVSPLNPPVLQFSINGKVLGSPFVTPVGTCNWNKFYAIWNSGSITTAVIRIVNQNIIANGNDFAIDDIKYVELCKVTNKVSVNVGPLTSITNIAICTSALPYYWNGINYPLPGTYSTHLTSTMGCDSVATLNLSVNPIPTITNTPIAQTICSGTSTLLVNLTSDVASTTFEWTASTETAITGFTTNGTNIIPAQTLSNPSNSTAGTVTYVIIPKANGCTGTAVNYVVTVNPDPITSTIYHK